MPAGSTYTPIATTTLGSSASSYTFSSIPQTYTDLVLVSVGSVATGGGISSIYAQFNSDTGANYSTTILYGNGTSALSTRESSVTNGVRVGQITDTVVTNSIAQIQNYANTTTYKTEISRANISDTRVAAQVGLWRSTAAITSITLTNNSGQNFAAGCTFTLYGIASA